MSDVAIRTVNLGKSYTILPGSSSQLNKQRTLQEDIVRIVKNPFKFSKQKKEEIWARQDVNFEIKKGEIVGVIGANGAGKSTLLKILSRITEPTTGHVDMYGRVGSLLEVGTGFHSELSGRENIYLNGAVLGMRKKEIDRKFDEIVDFSGVEKFLDTPVKRYSSGMRVRLAFSVAAHLDPEILLIDEVLSVGDAEFRKKSLGKMDEVARDGRTVLFVSHNMGAIRSLCTRTIQIEEGEISFDGDTREAVQEYLTHLANTKNLTGKVDLRDRINKYSPSPLIQELVIKNKSKISPYLTTGQKASFEITLENISSYPGYLVGVTFTNRHGERLASINSSDAAKSSVTSANANTAKATLVFEEFPLLPNQYNVITTISQSDRILDRIIDAASLDVREGNVTNARIPGTPFSGYFSMNGKWDIRNIK